MRDGNTRFFTHLVPCECPCPYVTASEQASPSSETEELDSLPTIRENDCFQYLKGNKDI